MFIAIIVAAVFVVLGAICLGIGIRGRRIGEQPVCNRCGFDLRGRAEGSDRCPECGADLRRRRAVGIGAYQRRSPWVVGGGVMLAIGLMLGGSTGYWQIAGINAIHYLPEWWLEREARSGDAGVRNPALVELLARMTAGTLSATQINSVADIALALQADRSKPWLATCGDLIVVAQGSGKLPADRWERYARQSVSFQFKVRPIVRRGDEIPISVSHDAPRCGSRQDLSLDETYTLRSTDLAPDNFYFGMHTRGSGAGASMTSVQIDPVKIARLSDGPHSVKITVNAGIRSWPYTGVLKTFDVPVDLESTFNLVPANTATVSAVDDDSLVHQVEQCITPRDFRWNSRGGAYYIEGMFDMRSAPVDLAFKVFFRSEGREWPGMGTINFAKGSTTGYGLGGEVTGLTATAKVDIILRPDAEAARATIGLTNFWNHEIVFRDVPVTGTPPKPAGIPATRAAGG